MPRECQLIWQGTSQAKSRLGQDHMDNAVVAVQPVPVQANQGHARNKPKTTTSRLVALGASTAAVPGGESVMGAQAGARAAHAHVHANALKLWN